MLNTHHKKTVLTTAVLMALSISANAQEAESAEKNKQDLEVIEVTAQNRVQSASDVPISMNVVSAELLDKAGVTDIQSLTRVAPDFVTANDSISTRVSLRGISTENNDEAADQSLTISIDGEYINRPRVMNAAMFDIQRVEVLRGPQGTLYGRNATGGAVNIITNKPQLDEFSGNISADFGNYNAREFTGALNIPLGEIAALRVAGFSTVRDGVRDHGDSGFKSGDRDVQAGRIGLQVEPSDNFTAYFAFETNTLDQQAPFFAAYNVNATGQADNGSGQCNVTAGWELVANIDGEVLCTPSRTNNLAEIDRENFEAPGQAAKAFHKVDGDAFRTQLDYELDWMTISYRGGYRDSTVDADEALHPNYIFYRNTNIKTTSHELRFSGGEDRLFWQGGLFQFVEEQNVSSGLLSFIGAYPNGPQGFWANTFYRPDVKSRSTAIFGQVDIPVTDTLTVVAGGRYTDDRKSATQTNLPGGLTFEEVPTLRSIDTDGAVRTDLLAEESEFTWTLGTNYQPDSSSLYYAKVSKGYKAGGFDSTGKIYDPEILYSFESGLKLDRDDYSVTGSAFYYDYTDLQVAILLDTSKGGQVFNAGEARIWGLEGTYNTWLTESDSLALSLNYLNTEYTEFAGAIPVQCLGGCGTTSISQIDGELVSLAGNKPSQAPEWIATLSYDHYWELEAGTLIGSIFTRYKSDYFASPFNDRDSLQQAYTQTDATLKFTTSDDTWEAMLYVRNIENENPLSYYTYTAAGPDDVQLWSFGPPRTFGAKVTYRFY
ncbi:MAG: TonB-dependent receptor [Gammaproteobacteria bacterium]|nr:TonB-dependent receptor [Gammaproteobacteria bacterium]